MPRAVPAPWNDIPQIAALLKLLANENRLMIVANLMASAELSVHELAVRVGLSQSSLSQHLARLRAGQMTEQRRQSQTIYYSITDDIQGRLALIFDQVFGPKAASRKVPELHATLPPQSPACPKVLIADPQARDESIGRMN